ncbi:MAG TPA: hypothetical protein P5121_09115 [Caldilineaceae bacterium]|nr:hypothetical protein [Caldilineaceae bacterium]
MIRNGAYDVQLDYTKPVPPPPLSARKQAWVIQLLGALSDR